MVTYPSALTPILDFIHSSKVATMQQTDGIVRLMKFGPKFLLIFFSNFFLKLGLKFSMRSQSHCYTSVTSDDMVTVTVILSCSHIEHSGRFEK